MSGETVRVLVPLSIRRRNGRPRVLPPESLAEQQVRAQDPHILKALGPRMGVATEAGER